MKDERWNEIERLFHAARELTGEDRSRFLDQMCGSDTAMRHEIEILLEQDAKSETFIRAFETKLKFCPRCGEALVALGDTDRCPDCGWLAPPLPGVRDVDVTQREFCIDVLRNFGRVMEMSVQQSLPARVRFQDNSMAGLLVSDRLAQR
jgi:predicted RNA-binding Zn-ribbon protein involved in translation (DUF1610 family)